MTRRLITRIAAAVVAACLAAGCVTQPVDETALTGLDPELGATAAPIADGDADRVADEAQTLSRQHAKGAKHRKNGVWTAPRKRKGVTADGGGLVRVDEPADDSPNRGDDGRTGTTDGEPPNQDGGDEDSGTQDPRGSTDDGRTGDGGSAGSDEGETDEGGSDGGGGKDEPPASPKPAPEPAPTFRAIAGASDPRDDASGQSPGYADIRQLLVESDGTHARVTVAVTGDIPRALAEGEVQGIGVDFYRGPGPESDYQLFVDGDDDGWRAFLQTPDGVVQYPGSFGVGGRVFVFELPWSTLGGRKPADVDMFIDWSKRKTPLNDAGNDRAPDAGKVRVDPR